MNLADACKDDTIFIYTRPKAETLCGVLSGLETMFVYRGVETPRYYVSCFQHLSTRQ